MAKGKKHEKCVERALEAAIGHGNRRVAGQDPVKRNQILDGARQVFLEVGFDGASMNDITRAAGVSKGTLYVYFQDKEDIFGTLVDRERGEVIRALTVSLEDKGSVAETLTRFGEALARNITSVQVIKLQRIIIGVADRMPELGARFYNSAPHLAVDMLGQYIKRQVAAGKLAIPDVTLACDQYYELCAAGLSRPALFGAKQIPVPAGEIEKTVASAVEMFLARYGTGEAQI